MTDPELPGIDEPAMRTRLGHEVFARMRRPGRPAGMARPARIGSVATSAARFAAGTSRPVPVRRALAGPEVPPVYRYRDVAVTPPRWWAPTVQYLAAESARAVAEAPAAVTRVRRRAALHRTAQPVSVADLPGRGLPRAVRRVPNEESWTPGRIADSLTPKIVPVRRMDAVTAAGPMLSNSERAAQMSASVARPATPTPLPPASRPRPAPAATSPAAARPGLFRRSAAERTTQQPAPHRSSATAPSTAPAGPRGSQATTGSQPSGPGHPTASTATTTATTTNAISRWRPAPSQRFARAVLDLRQAVEPATEPAPAGILTLAPLTGGSATAGTRAPLRRSPAARGPQLTRPGGRGGTAPAPAPVIVPPGTAPLRRAIRRSSALRPGLDLSRAPAVGAAPVVTRQLADPTASAASIPPARPGTSGRTSAGPAPTGPARASAPATPAGQGRHRAVDPAPPTPSTSPTAQRVGRPTAPPAALPTGLPAAPPIARTVPAAPAARPLGPIRRRPDAGLAMTAARGLRAAAAEPAELRPATAGLDLRAGISAPTAIGPALGVAVTDAPAGSTARPPAGRGGGPVPSAPPRRSVPGARAALRRRARSAPGRSADLAIPDLLPAHRPDAGPLAGRAARLASGFAPTELIAPAAGRPSAAGTSLPAVPSIVRTEGGPPVPASAALPLPAPPPVSISRSPARRSTAGPAAPARPTSAPSTSVASAGAAASAGTEVQRMIKLVDQMAQRDLATAPAARGGAAMAEDPTAPTHYTAGGEKPPLSAEDLLADRQWFDELVDRVVRRMERHVVDELERRGRRYGNGAY